jgi:hypothetical protein
MVYGTCPALAHGANATLSGLLPTWISRPAAPVTVDWWAATSHAAWRQASAPGPRLTIWPAMIARWTSLVPSQIRSTRSSR